MDTQDDRTAYKGGRMTHRSTDEQAGRTSTTGASTPKHTCRPGCMQSSSLFLVGQLSHLSHPPNTNSVTHDRTYNNVASSSTRTGGPSLESPAVRRADGTGQVGRGDAGAQAAISPGTPDAHWHTYTGSSHHSHVLHHNMRTNMLRVRTARRHHDHHHAHKEASTSSQASAACPSPVTIAHHQ
jgi:hypothetical protein